MKNIIVKMEGGLGNQMFQYAHALAIQKIIGGRIVLDHHAFNRKQIRSFSLGNYILNGNTKIAANGLDQLVAYFYVFFIRMLSKQNRLYNANDFQWYSKYGLCYQYQMRCFDSIFKTRSPYLYVSGNWLAPGFFKGCEKEAREAFRLKEQLGEKQSDMLSKIKNSESVCVHIRLGDYLAPKWKDKLYVCTPGYYHRAIEEIKKRVDNPKFFVFSNRHNDFEMIQESYNLGDVVYVDMRNTDVEDMELMRNCKHFVMSNSTYSWWSQYLSEYEGKVVIAPSRFNNYPEWDMTDIYSNEWNIIDV